MFKMDQEHLDKGEFSLKQWLHMLFNKITSFNVENDNSRVGNLIKDAIRDCNLISRENNLKKCIKQKQEKS